MSLRIAHVITGLETGGAEMLLTRLLEHLDQHTVQGQVISLTSRGTLAERIEAAGVEVSALGLRSVPGPVGLASLRKQIRAVRPDVVQTWLVHANVIGGLAAGRLPVVWGVHMSAAQAGTHGRATLAIQGLERRLSARVPKQIIACSKTAFDEMSLRGYDGSRLTYVPNGFDLSQFGPDSEVRSAMRVELGIANDVPVVGHFARFHPMKDHATMIGAARKVLAREPRAMFVFCGKGVSRENLALSAAVKPLGDSVQLLGERADVSRILCAVDLTALSSASGEAMPLVIGESMATGVPVVATDVGDARAMIASTGKVVPPRDPSALGGAIADLISLSAENRRALGARARDRIAAEYSLEEMVARYVSIWKAQRRTA